MVGGLSLVACQPLGGHLGFKGTRLDLGQLELFHPTQLVGAFVLDFHVGRHVLPQLAYGALAVKVEPAPALTSLNCFHQKQQLKLVVAGAVVGPPVRTIVFLFFSTKCHFYY